MFKQSFVVLRRQKRYVVDRLGRHLLTSARNPRQGRSVIRSSPGHPHSVSDRAAHDRIHTHPLQLCGGRTWRTHDDFTRMNIDPTTENREQSSSGWQLP